MVSNLLYQKRFGNYFVEPVIAGLDPITNKPYICGTDVIGSITEPRDFMVAGTGGDFAMAICEGISYT